ncbi:HET-domain-containing protein [Mytilinidion resinicola]|uniref:HET-domain-containing protein n=1 Tax=Mytilinidion resinicola TaxID=574789 RepID=A0A6A6YMG5_9PEZI|nr:HET-domain-containing protein [Mytilinidion resinicola]KAF2809773.1 HET-domain-containing protein [Mytilinidion resinicola]
MEEELKSVQPTCNVLQKPPVSAPKAIATLEELNSDAAKKVYRNRLASSELRLIKIHPGDGPSTVTCSSFSVQEGDLPDYEALSYVWGGQDTTKTILLDDVTWHVTPNLHSALSHLRFSDRFRVVWIDALAINQTDLQERNEQVKKMSAVYANATSTLIWLGEATDDLILVTFELLKSYSELTETDRRMWRTGFTTRDISFKSGIVSMMNRIFKLEYWQRIWVVQEILFSDQAFLMYGQHTIGYDDFFACMREISAVCAKSPEELEAIPQRSIDSGTWSLAALAHSTNLMISEVIPARGAARHGKHLSLRQWRTAQLKRSMDRRDKVFGYYGCFHPSIRQQIQVDYSKTLSEVITLMMRLLLKEEGLNMLLGPRMVYDPKYRIPSWAWSLMEPTTVPSRTLGTLSAIEDKSPGDWCAGGSLPSVLDFSEDGTVLHVRGKTVATIEATAPSFSSPPRNVGNDLFVLDNSLADLDFKTLMEHFRLTWQSFSLLPDFPSTLGFITAFWLQPSGPTLSELARWLCAGGSGSLGTSQTDYNPHLIDSLVSLHFHRRMFYFMPATMKPSTDPEVRHFQGQIHGESGLGPEDVAPGDKLCVLRGCTVPVVLRQEGDQYILLGEAYVPRIMRGEAIRAAEAGEEEYEDFWII